MIKADNQTTRDNSSALCTFSSMVLICFNMLHIFRNLEMCGFRKPLVNECYTPQKPKLHNYDLQHSANYQRD